eukprot:TRINITY_DN25_c0_g1_i6.p1 TRINITY_DN25_c0_g1~~TRINITY_DN25_c0_g1_i6.p1  ORF type:complete len:284 (+),score=66.15 TRINITY_DN25_c0_g1_i6:98-949(+)
MSSSAATISTDACALAFVLMCTLLCTLLCTADPGEDCRPSMSTRAASCCPAIPTPTFACTYVYSCVLYCALQILEKTAGKGINVYTHGELLPGNTYPELQKHKHLIGNWGGPWQLQKMEFGKFPGAIVLTSNCLVEPQKKYRGRIFTRKMVGWENIPHIADDWSNFDTVIDIALSAPGFAEDEPVTSVPAGYGHKAVVGLAGPILESIKSGDLKRFFVIGGCDGTEGERSYFGDLARHVPIDAAILTLGCGKFRFNRDTFETTKAGLPRMLDVGQVRCTSQVE